MHKNGLYSTVKISFQNNQPLRINEGRNSFTGSESISKRDQDLNEFLKKNLKKPTDLKSESISKRDQDLDEFLKKNFEKPVDLKLKGISNDKVSIVYYSTKPETSSLYSKPTSEEEDDSKSVCPSACPSDGDFPSIDDSDYIKQLRVLTVLNESFEVDLVPLHDEFMLSKNRIKRKYFQDNFAQSEKNRVKRKWLEKMNHLKKHILFFDFLENYYVSNDEVSKQHLSVIKKSNFVKAADKSNVRSTHPPLETVLITCQDQKTEVRATPFKIADEQTPIISIIEQNNFTNESLHVIGQQLDRIEEKIVERTVSIEKPASEKYVLVKTKKPLINLPSQTEKVMFKTSQSKMLEVVDKILSNLKVKTEGTSRSTACTISKNGKEIISDENIDSDTVSSVSAKKIFDDIPKIKRFIGNFKTTFKYDKEVKFC